MKKLMMSAAMLVAMGAPAFAQQMDNLPAANHIVVQGNTVTTTGTTTSTQNTTGKSVRNMTDSERQAFWDSLPDAEKKRIEERRAQAQAAKNPWRQGGLSNNDMRTAKLPAGSKVTEGVTGEMTPEMANGKAAWDAMTTEQKRQFITDHQGEIQNAVQGQQQSGAAGSGQ